MASLLLVLHVKSGVLLFASGVRAQGAKDKTPLPMTPLPAAVPGTAQAGWTSIPCPPKLRGISFHPDLDWRKTMRPDLPLEQMTVADKIMTMEALWDSLCRDDEQVESPLWHGEVLDQRMAALESGEVELEDLEVAKRKIRDQLG